MLWLQSKQAAAGNRLVEMVEVKSEDEPSSSPPPAPSEESDIPPVTLRGTLSNVFNPMVVGLLCAVVVVLIPPLQRLLFERVPLIRSVTESLGVMSIGGHLLVLGFGLWPFKVQMEWLIIFLAAGIRLVIVPAVLFALFFGTGLYDTVSRVEVAWVPLTLSGTPSNLGVVVLASIFRSDAAPQILLVAYLCALVTVPGFNVALLSLLTR